MWLINWKIINGFYKDPEQYDRCFRHWILALSAVYAEMTPYYGYHDRLLYPTPKKAKKRLETFYKINTVTEFQHFIDQYEQYPTHIEYNQMRYLSLNDFEKRQYIISAKNDTSKNYALCNFLNNNTDFHNYDHRAYVLLELMHIVRLVATVNIITEEQAWYRLKLLSQRFIYSCSHIKSWEQLAKHQINGEILEQNTYHYNTLTAKYMKKAIKILEKHPKSPWKKFPFAYDRGHQQQIKKSRPFFIKVIKNKDVRDRNEQANCFYNAMKQGHYRLAIKHLQQLKTGHWDERLEALLLITPNNGFRWDELGSLNKQFQNNTEALLIQAVFSLKWGHEARGADRSENVSDENYQRYYERLSIAYHKFHDAIELDAKDPTAFSQLILIEPELFGKDGEEKINGLFHEATLLDPYHYATHNCYMTRMTKKWGGSHQLMYNFAKTVDENIPKGHLLSTMKVHAHIEYWLYVSHFDKNIAKENKFLTNKTINDDIIYRYEQLKDKTQFMRSLDVFAFWFYLTKNIDYLRDVMTRIPEGEFDSYPFCYIASKECTPPFLKWLKRY